MTKEFPLVGTVSAGTMQPGDLIPRFIDALSLLLEGVDPYIRHDPSLHQGPGPDGSCPHCQLQSWLGRKERQLDMIQMGCQRGPREEALFDLSQELWECLALHAPPGLQFGSHPGDGADYGYWPCDDQEEA